VTSPGRVIPYGRQDIDDADIAAVVEALRSEFLTQGRRVADFEAALAEACGARHAVAVSSGTAALHLAALAAGVGPGDLVYTSANTFVASANCALYAGAEPRLVDIEPDGGLSLEALERALSRASGGRPRAVVPVHFAGHPVDLPALAKLARRHGLAVIEDACHALGAVVVEDGRAWPVGCGRWSDMAVLSTHPVKHVTTGEGGAVLTNDDTLAARLRTLRTHGIVREPQFLERREGADEPWWYEMQSLGLNYRLTDIQAALGASQLRRLPAFVARRRAIAARYAEALAGLPAVRLPEERPWARHSYHLYVIQVDFARLGTTRAEAMRRLRAEGVGSQVHYIPIYRQPYFRRRFDWSPGAYPGCEQFYAGALSIPMFPAMTDADVDQVVRVVRRVLGRDA
jgi:UDP-4-amino-4,6-dideoxy-N-acetyl-beta-L-altrosamine transaminase